VSSPKYFLIEIPCRNFHMEKGKWKMKTGEFKMEKKKRKMEN
jgi:hypothetical protein